jgi:hypothetical protein
MTLYKWENILDKYNFNEDGKSLKTSRMKIPEGWLYLHIQMQSVNGQIVKSESMAFVPEKKDSEGFRMNNYWVSWYHKKNHSPFEIHSPWWISGEDENGSLTICAAIKAHDQHHARSIILSSYDDLPDNLQFRFFEERPYGWIPFTDRFPKAEWMKWEEREKKDSE